MKKRYNVLLMTMLGIVAVSAGCSKAEKIEAAVPKTQNTVTAAPAQSQVQVSISSSTEAAAQVAAQPAQAQGKQITPLPSAISIDNLDNCTFAASFTNDDIFMDGGALKIRLTVYDRELFDMVDIAQMKVGDVLVLKGKNMPVTSVKREDSGMVIVNGGEEEGGCDLSTDDNGVYSAVAGNGMYSYYEVGKKELPVDQEFLYHDNSDLDNPDDIYYPGDLITNADGHDFTCDASNGTVRVENGFIVEITKRFVP